VFPYVYQRTPEEEEREKAKETFRRASYEGQVEALKNGDDTGIDDALVALEKVEEAELERRRSVESRLTSVLGMASISTALFGALISLQAKLGGSKSLDGLLWPAIIASTYGMVQLLLATLAAVKGLKRRPQIAMGIEDYLGAPGETKRNLQIRTLKELVGKILDDEKVNCRRMDQMEVAHEALRNFLVAMLLLAILWPLGFMLGPKASPAPDTGPIIKELLSTPSLVERLRGPAGPQGPSGSVPTVLPDSSGRARCPCAVKGKKKVVERSRSAAGNERPGSVRDRK